jgi:hypothetical protein
MHSRFIKNHPIRILEDIPLISEGVMSHKPMVKRIRLLADQGLTLMMVLFDFLSKHITHLQLRALLTCLYTRENDTTWLEGSRGSDLDPKVLDTMLMMLSPDLIYVGFLIPPTVCASICLDRAAQPKLLKELPTLDDIDIAVQQLGDQS